MLLIVVAFGYVAWHLWFTPAIDFNQEVRPILNKRCMSCHGGVKRSGGLSLLTREDALQAGESGKAAIVPGQAERSEAVAILHAVLAEMDDDKRELFLLADLEGVPVAEIASFKKMKLFTVYSRLRAARAQFKKLVGRYRTTHGWRAS